MRIKYIVVLQVMSQPFHSISHHIKSVLNLWLGEGLFGYIYGLAFEVCDIEMNIGGGTNSAGQGTEGKGCDITRKITIYFILILALLKKRPSLTTQWAPITAPPIAQYIVDNCSIALIL